MTKKIKGLKTDNKNCKNTKNNLILKNNCFKNFFE